MGSDLFSVPSLTICLARSDVVAVYTQPDRRSGRGRKQSAASPVKALALTRGLRVEQPERFDKRCSDQLRELAPDLTVVAAYGELLPPEALGAARVDSINVHASLLPRHRGAAPIAAAILAGDAEAGVTLMRLRPELDAGEIIRCGDEHRRAQAATPIGPDETAGELAERLATIGGELLADVLRAFADGSVTYELQDDARATYAPMLSKADGLIDWAKPADEIVRHIRAMTPWPGAHTELHVPEAEPIRIVVLRAEPVEAPEAEAGQVCMMPGDRLVIAAGQGAVELLEVQPASRKAMPAASFARGCSALKDGSGEGGGCWCGRS